MIARQPRDAFDGDPEAVPGQVAVAAGATIAREGRGIAIALADEEPRSQGGRIVDAVGAAGEEALPLALRGRGAGREQQRGEDRQESRRDLTLHGRTPFSLVTSVPRPKPADRDADHAQRPEDQGHVAGVVGAGGGPAGP